MVFVDGDVGDHDALAGFRGDSLLLNEIGVIGAVGLHLSIGGQGERSDGQRAHGESLLGLQKAQKFFAIMVRKRQRGERDVCGRGLEILCVYAFGRDSEYLSGCGQGQERGEEREQEAFHGTASNVSDY
ncbi:MAG TPA: hypothetical protein VGM17_00625 [Rhizomicrobium sp.]